MASMRATRLVTKDINDVADAGFMIGDTELDRQGNRLAPLVLKPARSGCSWWIVIPKGFSAIVVQHGRFLGVWRAGVHAANPFVQITHLIPQQYIVYDTPVKECPTQDNVMVQIDVTLVFHILQDEQNLENFAYKLGPESLDKLLRALQEETVRSMARTRKYTSIYDLMDTKADLQLEQVVDEMNDKLREYGVNVTRITITNVHLPDDIAATMQEATSWESKNRYNKVKQQYDMAIIDHGEAETKARQKVQETLKKEEQELLQAQDVAAAELRAVEAETKKLKAEIEERSRGETMGVSAKADAAIEAKRSELTLLLSRARAGYQAEATDIAQRSRAEIMLLNAAADRTVAETKAKALVIQAAAEKKASLAMKARREYEYNMRQLHTLKALAENDKIVVSGSNGDNSLQLAQIVAARESAGVLGLPMR